MRKQNKENVLKYLNLDLNIIPNTIVNKDDIDIKTSEINNEKNYKVYKYLPIKDINIVLTDARRLDSPAKKVESMKDLSYYLNKNNEGEYGLFLNMLENASITDIDEIEKFQKSIKSKVPSKIKYNKDYLWQIYYIERTNKYYMIVPIQETETQGFFYVLKQKIEESNEKIYVPICNMGYSNLLIESTKISTLENNLYFFIKEWPLVYEVYDNKDNISLNIIGNIEIYENIKSDYKMTYTNKEEIKLFYQLIKTLFYLQTEIPNFYKFDIVLDSKGIIHFFHNDYELTNNTLEKFYKDEIKQNLKNIEDVEKIQKGLVKKTGKLKIEEKKLNAELSNKQKQIATFLECKKTFLGRVKYFFKSAKKKQDTIELKIVDEEINVEKVDNEVHSYSDDIEDLIYICKKLMEQTTNATTTRLEIQNLNTKIKILRKKIENASKYIEEIESHKKSIFEFWKFTNKDEKNQLAEGTPKEEFEKRIEKDFNIKEDLAEISKYIDLNQRKRLTEEEKNAVFAAAVIGLDNITKPETDLNLLLEKEDLIEINNGSLTHREKPRDLKNIFENKNKLTKTENSIKLKEIYKNINNALKKCTINIDLPVYALEKPESKLMMFEINPEKLDFNVKEMNLYKLNVKTNTNILALSNIIFFNNRNDTLPIGMDYSTNIFVDLRKTDILEVSKKTNYIVRLLNNSPKQIVTKFNVTEFNI